MRKENFNMVGILISLIIGAVCGWLAGIIMKSGHGLLINMLLGLAGGVVGGLIFKLLGFSINGTLGSIISGVVGSCLVIFLVRLIKK